MDLIYKVEDKPKFSQMVVYAFQQLLAIMAATLAVPVIVNQATGSNMDIAAALFGAGVGTMVYQLFTKSKSPVFLGSSFAFLGSMMSAFWGAASMSLGYLGLIIGAGFAGLVYVVIALIVKKVGVGWIDKLMPPVVIGPTVAIIGLSLAGNAIGDLTKGNVAGADGNPLASTFVCLICGLVTLFVTMLCSTYGKKGVRLIPFIIGILAGYCVALIFTLIGNASGNDAFKVISFAPFANLLEDGKVTLKTFFSVPRFTFLEASKGFSELNAGYIGTVAVAYLPVAFVVFAEHLADHKNISSIIGRDLLKDPGLNRTLLGDGVGSFFGALFGGCPNTTYGESIACVAITRNASTCTIFCTAILAMIISFINPFVAFLNTIPSCVMGGVCMALYGFIAVSGLKMLQKVDLNENRNLFTASVILIAGIGGLSLSFGSVTLTTVACALILGIITNQVLSRK